MADYRHPALKAWAENAATVGESRRSGAADRAGDLLGCAGGITTRAATARSTSPPSSPTDHPGERVAEPAADRQSHVTTVLRQHDVIIQLPQEPAATQAVQPDTDSPDEQRGLARAAGRDGDGGSDVTGPVCRGHARSIRSRAPLARSDATHSRPAGSWPARRGPPRTRARAARRPPRRYSSAARG